MAWVSVKYLRDAKKCQESRGSFGEYKEKSFLWA